MFGFPKSTITLSIEKLSLKCLTLKNKKEMNKHIQRSNDGIVKKLWKRITYPKPSNRWFRLKARYSSSGNKNHENVFCPTVAQ